MILLDTYTLVWFISNPEKLSLKARKLIEEEREKYEILISSISVWEISVLVKRERLKLIMDLEEWIERIESLPFLNFVPVDNRIAIKSVNLPEPFHKDPAGRIIVTTGILENAIIITSDRKILKYPYVKSV